MAQNRGLSRITTNLGVSVFDGASLPSNAANTYAALLRLHETLGKPSEIVVRKETQGAEMAAVYRDVAGKQVFVPMIGFNLVDVLISPIVQKLASFLLGGRFWL